MEKENQKTTNKYFSESVRTRRVFKNLVLHIHPAQVRKVSLEYTHTMGLGGMLVILFLIQAFTGIILRFVYEPSPEKAYDSILAIQQTVIFGQFVRNIHHLSGMLMVVIAFFHMLRTFFTEAFKPPRKGNWIIGVVLMLLIVFSNFSGYLLPWDQLSYWAVTVATSMFHYIPFIGEWLVEMIRGGSEVGAVTLLNFFNFHTAILPLGIVILMAFHFWKVRKAGGVVVPDGKRNEDKEYVSTIPNLVAREFVVALMLIAFIVFISAVWNAPLLERANPALSPNPAKAPWYFLGIQELLMHFHPFFAAFVIPSIFLIALFWLPYQKFEEDRAGFWFASARGKGLCKNTALFSLLTIPLLVLANEYIPDLIESTSGIWAIVGNGLIPFIILLSGLLGWVWWLRKKGNYSKNEIIQGMFVLWITSYLVLMFIAIWFRGEGMELCWPWYR